MYCVYILKSRDSDNTYVGLTTRSPDVRLKEHNKGMSYYTKRHMPWELVYYELLHCKQCAKRRERFYKSGVGVKIKQIIVRNFEVN